MRGCSLWARLAGLGRGGDLGPLWFIKNSPEARASWDMSDSRAEA